MDTERSKVYKCWDDGFVIRRMALDDAPQVIDWRYDEIMPVDLQLALDIRRDDEDGFYVGEMNGEMVASYGETLVAGDLQHVSYIYVVEKYRMSGFARRMITTALEINRRRNWKGITGLDAVQNVESMYEKFDYKMDHNISLYQGTVSTNADHGGFETDIREVKSVVKQTHSINLSKHVRYIASCVANDSEARDGRDWQMFTVSSVKQFHLRCRPLQMVK